MAHLVDEVEVVEEEEEEEEKGERSRLREEVFGSIEIKVFGSSLSFSLFLRFRQKLSPLTLPVHALTMIGGVEAAESDAAIAATAAGLLRRALLLLESERCRRAIGSSDLLTATLLALLLLVLAVAGAWLPQQPSGRRIAEGLGERNERGRQHEAKPCLSKLL